MTKLAHRFALIILPSLTMLVMGVIPSLLDGNRALTLILFGASTVLLTGVAWFASKRLQEEFSRPILDLVETAREISSTQDFSIRAVTDSDGEVGLLNDAVNDMLVQMEKRHRDLVEEGDRLTAEVTARTQEVLESKEAHSRELRESNELRASNKQLAAATGQAIAASHAKSQFMANLTHEIRTPINGALGMTELLLNTDLTPQQTKFARTVLESGEDLLSIVNDILDFSKVEAGKLERVDHRLFSPKDCVTKVSELLKGRAELKGLTLSTECADDLPHTMLGDGQRLRQVLTNFVGNAIKFTEQGQIVIRTTVAKESDDFRTIRFEVVDTGVGIADHLHEYVFEGFSQADNSTAHQFGGAHPHGTSTGDIHRAALRVRPLRWVSLNQSTEVGVPQSITGREDPTRLDGRRACGASPERRASAMGSRHRTATDRSDVSGHSPRICRTPYSERGSQADEASCITVRIAIDSGEAPCSTNYGGTGSPTARWTTGCASWRRSSSRSRSPRAWSSRAASGARTKPPTSGCAALLRRRSASGSTPRSTRATAGGTRSRPG